MSQLRLLLLGLSLFVLSSCEIRQPSHIRLINQSDFILSLSATWWTGDTVGLSTNTLNRNANEIIYRDEWFPISPSSFEITVTFSYQDQEKTVLLKSDDSLWDEQVSGSVTSFSRTISNLDLDLSAEFN